MRPRERLSFLPAASVRGCGVHSRGLTFFSSFPTNQILIEFNFLVFISDANEDDLERVGGWGGCTRVARGEQERERVSHPSGPGFSLFGPCSPLSARVKIAEAGR